MLLIKTIIVDDEKKAREGLEILLESDTSIEIVSVCKNGLEALDYLQKHKVQLAFLDIQMPGINGFEVLNSLPKEQRPFIVFVTAYDAYALKAFDYHALDYLLKPFTNERFKEALLKAKQQIQTNAVEQMSQKIELLLKNFEQTPNYEKTPSSIITTEAYESSKIIIKTSKKKIVFINLIDIQWIEAFDYYAKIHTISKTYLIRESLKRLAYRLPSSFIRIHKSSIVNIHFIKELQKLKNTEYELVLNNDKILKVSRSYSKNLSTYLQI